MTEMNQLKQGVWANRENNDRQKLGSILMAVLLGVIAGESQFPVPLLAQTPNAPSVKDSNTAPQTAGDRQTLIGSGQGMPRQGQGVSKGLEVVAV